MKDIPAIVQSHMAKRIAQYGQEPEQPLREMDQIVYPVCTLCRDHERSGFIQGVQVGIRLAEELK